MKKLLFSIFALFFLTLNSPILAADLEVSCNSSSCSSSPSNGPIFYETNILPLDTFTRTLTAQNTSSDALNFAIEVKQPYTTNTLPSLSNVISLTITEIETSSIVYGPKTIDQWRADGFISLSNIPAGQERNYRFDAVFENVGNEYQGRKLVFDLNLGFDTLPEGDNGTTAGTSTSGGNGTGGGFSCTDTIPSSAPTLSAVQNSTNSIILNWTSVSPATHYMIRYGTLAGNYIYGASNVGNVNSFVVSQLSSGTTYYFQVAGVNGCMPGPWSNEVSISPFGAVLQEAPAPGFVEGVLGAQDEEGITPTPVNEGQVSGATACAEKPYPWWLPLAIQALLTLIYFVFIGKKRHRRYFWIVPIILAILSQIIHAYLGCNCATGNLCPYYWLFNLAIVIISFILYVIKKNKHAKKGKTANG